MTQDHSAQHELRHSLESAGYDITNCSVKCEELRNHQQFHKHSFFPPRSTSTSAGRKSCDSDDKRAGRCHLHSASASRFQHVLLSRFRCIKSISLSGFLLRLCPVFRGTFGTFSSFTHETCWVFKWLITVSTSGFYS